MTTRARRRRSEAALWGGVRRYCDLLRVDAAACLAGVDGESDLVRSPQRSLHPIAGVLFLFMGYRAEGTLKRSRILLGAGIVVAGIGTGSSNFVELSSGSAAPVPSVPDLIYFASLPLIVIGLLYYPMSPNVSVPNFERCSMALSRQQRFGSRTP